MYILLKPKVLHSLEMKSNLTRQAILKLSETIFIFFLGIDVVSVQLFDIMRITLDCFQNCPE